MDLKNYFWVFPFVCFFLGYQLVSLLTVANTLENPPIIGLPLSQAIKTLSDHNLNPRIMAEKEEQDLPEGTVLSQTPNAKQKVKQNQPIFLVVSKKPATVPAPLLRGRTLNEAEQVLNHLNLRPKYYQISSPTPAGTCIGQLPDAKEPTEGRKITLYMSTGKNQLMLFPSFKGAFVHDAQQCLSSYQTTVKIFHSTPTDPAHQCSTCIITDQKPLPGTIVDVQKPIYVQLQVQ